MNQSLAPHSRKTSLVVALSLLASSIAFVLAMSAAPASAGTASTDACAPNEVTKVVQSRVWVEYRSFHIYAVDTTLTCGQVVTFDYGYIDIITSYPFFAECTATSACTPKP